MSALVAVGLWVVLERDRDQTAAPAPTTVVADTGSREPLALQGEALDIFGVLDKVQPSVVSIETGAARGGGLFGRGAGSGVIVTTDGLVVTNAHVIDGADSIQVRLFSGEMRGADLVGASRGDDIALVRIRDAADLVAAELGVSGDLQVGDDVVAIGNALNLGGQPTVTTGIVSATDRAIGAGGTGLTNLIQTDAAINPGNSGGALVNARGEVVGIPTAIIGDAQNIGFAIEIDVVKPLIEDLQAGGGDVRPGTFLGVSTLSVSELTAEQRDALAVDVDEGAVITEVVPTSGADVAGLLPGDVIVAIDGTPTPTAESVGPLVRERDAGDTITLEVRREGGQVSVEATLGAR